MSVVGDLSERALIARIQQRLARAPEWLVIGIGDDAAVAVPAPRQLEVFTVDALVEGIHFDRRFTVPEAIGHRALAANLSDLAAMGASPRLALLSMALPADYPVDHLDRLVGALSDLANQSGIVVAGGNLTRSPGPLMIDITAVGAVRPRQVLARRGARPGDALYVSGWVGSAAAGLAMLRALPDGVPPPAVSPQPLSPKPISPTATEPPASPPPHDDVDADECLRRYLYPQPRVRLGTQLARNRAATACIDLSDGLGAAVAQLAEASGVGAIIDGTQLPIHPATRRWFETAGMDPLAAAVAGGDDYELLFAVRTGRYGRLRNAVRHGDVAVTKIGVCTADNTIVIRHQRDGRQVDEPLPDAYRHFR